jgi:hypothetical protein
MLNAEILVKAFANFAPVKTPPIPIFRLASEGKMSYIVPA